MGNYNLGIKIVKHAHRIVDSVKLPLPALIAKPRIMLKMKFV
jgi:hypothetical protein